MKKDMVNILFKGQAGTGRTQLNEYLFSHLKDEKLNIVSFSNEKIEGSSDSIMKMLEEARQIAINNETPIVFIDYNSPLIKTEKA